MEMLGDCIVEGNTDTRLEVLRTKLRNLFGNSESLHHRTETSVDGNWADMDSGRTHAFQGCSLPAVYCVDVNNMVWLAAL